MKAIIIEDETAAVRNLRAVLNDSAPDMQIIAVLDSVQKSVEWLKSNDQPDIIFMDIQLSDGDSFHIFNRVEVKAPVIFTTAYNEYALQAFTVNSIDYLLKPIKPEEVVRALTKLKLFSGDERNDYISRMAKLFPQKNSLKTLLISYKDSIIPLDVENIACFYGKEEKVSVYTMDESVLHTEKTLNFLTENLDSVLFFRANRQFIISRKAIKEIKIWHGNRLNIQLSVQPGEQIIISKERVPELKKWLTRY